MGNETFYWDGQNNSVLARYIVRMRFAVGFWPPRFRDLGEIRGRILAAQIPRDLSSILAAEI